MEFKELIKFENNFNIFLNYKGYNLWKISEVPLFENFIKFPKKRNFLNRKKDLLLREIVKLKNKKKEIEDNEEIGKNKDILILVYGISPVNTFKPIIDKLKEKIKIVRYDPPSEDITKEILEKNKINYSNIDNYINQDIKESLKKSKEWLREVWNKIKKDKELKKDLNENYEKIINGLEYFCRTRKVYLEIIRLIELYERMINIEKPKILIVSDDSNFYGNAAVLVAKRLGIKTICIQHGQLEGNVVTKNGADKIIVNGYKDKEYLISQGIDKNKIVVTGQIRFDLIAQKIRLNKEEICKKYNLDLKKKIIVYSYQKPIPGENIITSAKGCFLENIREFNKDKKYQIIITMRTDVSIPKEFKENGLILLPGVDIQELAICSDILITAFSTAAIEFVLMNKPVIAINIKSKPEEYIDYTKLGVGFKITKKEDFLPALKICLDNKKFKLNFKRFRKKFIRDYNYKMDGKSLNRIIKLIKKEL